MLLRLRHTSTSLAGFGSRKRFQPQPAGSSNPGAVLAAAGSRPNRKGRELFAAIEEAPVVDALGLEHAICHGKFNRKENTQQYHKPPKLKLTVEELILVEPKLKAPEIHSILQKRRRDHKDGGLMFCYAERGTWPRDQLCICASRNRAIAMACYLQWGRFRKI
jgi:hypothetical protein